MHGAKYLQGQITHKYNAYYCIDHSSHAEDHELCKYLLLLYTVHAFLKNSSYKDDDAAKHFVSSCCGKYLIQNYSQRKSNVKADIWV